MSVCTVTNIVEGIQGAIREQIQGIHTSIPATIVSYDAASGTATVQPMMKYEKPNGEKILYPQVSGVPVTSPQGSAQGCSMGFPIKPGDGCVLLASERPLDYWMYGRETDTDLSYDLTNSIAIPGLFNAGSDAMREANDNDALVMMMGGSKITVSDSAVKLEINGASLEISGGKIKITGDVEVSGKVDTSGDVTGQGKHLASHTHTDSSGGRTTSPN